MVGTGSREREANNGEAPLGRERELLAHGPGSMNPAFAASLPRRPLITDGAEEILPAVST